MQPRTPTDELYCSWGVMLRVSPATRVATMATRKAKMANILEVLVSFENVKRGKRKGLTVSWVAVV